MATRSKLAVILHADVVGSTALVQMDARLAHERIREAFGQFSETILRYGGTAHEVRGDALVAEFNRASDAVAASLAFQAANHATDQALPGEIRPQLRIGIALGEVIIADQTVTGAGVVLAQRLEQVAQPGGVCVQNSVRESVPSRFPFDYEDRGEQSLKGFDEPVEPFFVRLRAGEALPAPEMDTLPEAPTEPAGRRRVAFVIVAMLVMSAGVASWWQPWTRAPEATASTPALERSTEHRSEAVVLQAEERTPGSQLSTPLKPSIAVLAFTNMSADPDQDFFAEGIAEDIITDLSRVEGLFVIARNSSFSYKGKNVTVKAIARELGVRYVLEGSVRRSGDTLRINAQLVDASTEGHVWAKRYDGDRSDVFGLQDAVGASVVDAISVAFKLGEHLQRDHGTSNADAYDAYLMGMRHLNAVNQWHQDDNGNARRAFARAIELDAGYANAYAGLGWTSWYDFIYFTLSASDRALALQLARKSISLSDNAPARSLLARSHLQLRTSTHGRSSFEREYDQAIEEMRRALALEPQNPDILAELAYTLVYAGEPAEAHALLVRAIRLNPNFPDWYHQPRGIAQFLLGDYKGAETAFSAVFEAGLDESGASNFPLWLAAAQAKLGNTEQASKILANLRNESAPGKAGPTLGAVRYRTPLRKEVHMNLFIDALREAGLQDEAQ